MRKIGEDKNLRGIAERSNVQAIGGFKSALGLAPVYTYNQWTCGGVPKMGVPQVTIGFNTKMVQ